MHPIEARYFNFLFKWGSRLLSLHCEILQYYVKFICEFKDKMKRLSRVQAQNLVIATTERCRRWAFKVSLYFHKYNLHWNGSIFMYTYRQ